MMDVQACGNRCFWGSTLEAGKKPIREVLGLMDEGSFREMIKLL